jgi:hypothetical protein
MSAQSNQAKVYDMLKAANGPVSVDTLNEIEGIKGGLEYRLSIYVWGAKKEYGAVIVPVRDGRKVVAYQLVDAGAGVTVKAPKAKKTAPVAVAKAPKAPKAKKTPVSVPTVPEADLKSDPIVSGSKKVVDILDEMDTSVASFEDRQFAEEFVRSL